MRLTSLIRLVFLLCAATLLTGSAVNAQSLFLSPDMQTGHANDLITYDIKVTGGIANAIGWGTNITIDPTAVQFMPDFGGASAPFLNTQPYFDFVFDNSLSPDGSTLHINYLNLSSPDNFNVNTPVTLGQFQIKVLHDLASETDISVASLDTPPAGTAVQDMSGLNLLIGVSGARILPASTSVPEPGSMAVWGMGLTFIGMIKVKSRRRNEIRADRVA